MSSFEARLRKLETVILEEQARRDDAYWERLAIYRDAPVEFQRDVLGRELWSKQRKVCEAVVDFPVTVIPAGKAIGKSYLLAGLVIWWLYTRKNSRCITTGPDFRQVVSVLWDELRRALFEAPEPLRYEHLSHGYAAPQRLVLDSQTRWGALGFATQSEEGLAGQHSGDLLVLVDEASGVAPQTWSAIHGLAANRLVVSGNPLRWDSRFRELHDMAVNGSPQVTTVPISSLESPHADMDISPWGMADRSFLQFNRELHGEFSPWWRSSILGLFPGQESDSFLPPAWIDRCADPGALTDELWVECAPGPTFLAVDISLGVGADKSVVVVRDRRQLLEVFASEWHGVGDDARHRLEDVVLELALKWKVTPDRATFDKAGVGRNFENYMAARGYAGMVGYFGAASGGRLFRNRRSSNAFALKRRLDPHTDDWVPFYCGGTPYWPQIRKELVTIRDCPMEMIEGQVKQSIELRESLAARLHHSPDFADALIQSFTYL